MTVLIDIEGTAAPLAFVHEILFPFARERLDTYLTAHWADLAPIRKTIEADAGAAFPTVEAMTAHLHELMDRDAKLPGLKQLQGRIWADGYARKQLRSPVYADVVPALQRWKAAGRRMAIYSSGSIDAQITFFRNTDHGDLTPYFAHYYDTTSGPKREADSYRNIARDMNESARTILFLSDVVAELDAAREAGLKTTLLTRPGNAVQPPHDHPVAATFDEIA